MYDAIKVKPEYLLLSYSWILIETGFTLKMMKDEYNDILQCLMLYLALPLGADWYCVNPGPGCKALHVNPAEDNIDLASQWYIYRLHCAVARGIDLAYVEVQDFLYNI